MIGVIEVVFAVVQAAGIVLALHWFGGVAEEQRAKSLELLAIAETNREHAERLDQWEAGLDLERNELDKAIQEFIALTEPPAESPALGILRLVGRDVLEHDVDGQHIVNIADTPNPPRGYSLHAAGCAAWWVVDGVRPECTCNEQTPSVLPGVCGNPNCPICNPTGVTPLRKVETLPPINDVVVGELNVDPRAQQPLNTWLGDFDVVTGSTAEGAS